MSISFTLHKTPQNVLTNALGEQVGDRVDVAIGGASAPMTVAGLYRLKAGADCRVRIGAADVTASTGGRWSNGDTEVRWIDAGQVVKVAAA